MATDDTDPVDRSAQQRDADALAERLAATAGELAAHMPRLPVTAATPERVDTVTLLTTLSQQLPDLCRRAILGEVGNDEWERLASALTAAARACREQIVIDLDTTDSEGSDSNHTS